MFSRLYPLDCGIRENDRKCRYNSDGSNRSILTATWNGKSTFRAVAIGINPSMANEERGDRTITMLVRFLNMYGFQQFHMLNLFESYSTQQSGINPDSRTDFSKFQKELQEADAIIIAWGVNNRDYKEEKRVAMRELSTYIDKLYCIKNDSGNYPTHPSRLKYRYEFCTFEFNEYLSKL